MGKTAKRSAAVATGCSHKHDPKYDMCLGCKIRERARKRVEAGGLTTEQLKAEKLKRAQALVAAAAGKPSGASKGSRTSSSNGNGEIAALRADFEKLTGLVTGLVQAISSASATA